MKERKGGGRGERKGGRERRDKTKEVFVRHGLSHY